MEVDTSTTKNPHPHSYGQKVQYNGYILYSFGYFD
jgi:hypothetical protein